MSQTHMVEVKAGTIAIDALPDRKLVRVDIAELETHDGFFVLTRDQLDTLIRALSDAASEL